MLKNPIPDRDDIVVVSFPRGRRQIWAAVPAKAVRCPHIDRAERAFQGAQNISRVFAFVECTPELQSKLHHRCSFEQRSGHLLRVRIFQCRNRPEVFERVRAAAIEFSAPIDATAA